MSIKRLAWVPLLAAWAASVAYIFVFGVDWEQQMLIAAVILLGWSSIRRMAR
jgi:hypothetical protein